MTSPELEDLLSDTREVVIPDVEPDVFKQILETARKGMDGARRLHDGVWWWTWGGLLAGQLGPLFVG
ncbi:hypothetical protein J6590_037856 [Homalodisca vitripennis]|nr:hypothetical protein J6590_037856 [Homalodisca vitripennis]